MGTWGTGPFDDESGWAWETQEAHDWSVVDVALRGAADVGPMRIWRRRTAKLLGLPLPLSRASDDPSTLSLPDEVTEWLDHHREAQPPATRQLAWRAVHRVLADNSELVELWQEAGEAGSPRASSITGQIG